MTTNETFFNQYIENFLSIQTTSLHHLKGKNMSNIFKVVSVMCALLGASPALATSCVEREPVVKYLKEKYGETRNSFGLTKGGVVEMYANKETGTWTMLLTKPDGKACLLTRGEFYTRELKGEIL